MTLFANSPWLLSLILLFPTGLLLLLPPREQGTPLPSNGHPSRPTSPIATSPSTTSLASPLSAPTIAPLPSLTIYRAHMLLMTILAILAVDFPVFPRSLAKCETHGVSLVCSLLLLAIVNSYTFVTRWTSVSVRLSFRKGWFLLFL
jgi:glucosaminylphosphatidylinositol acyltransferase